MIEKNDRTGYPRRCKFCEEMIWMQHCSDGRWKPFDFPNGGGWKLHDHCPGKPSFALAGKKHKGTENLMRPHQIGSDGVLRKDGAELSLLETDIPVPPHLRSTKTQDTEKVLFIVEASLYLEYCSVCKAPMREDAIMLVMETIRVIPAHCCDTFLWFDEDEYDAEGYSCGIEP